MQWIRREEKITDIMRKSKKIDAYTQVIRMDYRRDGSPERNRELILLLFDQKDGSNRSPPFFVP
jgi:hypothetical protein